MDSLCFMMFLLSSTLYCLCKLIEVSSKVLHALTSNYIVQVVLLRYEGVVLCAFSLTRQTGFLDVFSMGQK